MLLPRKQKHSFILIIIVLFGLFLTETYDLLASDAENNIEKYPDFTTDVDMTRFRGVNGLELHALNSHRNHCKRLHPPG
jgi:hypothetical protein